MVKKTVLSRSRCRQERNLIAIINRVSETMYAVNLASSKEISDLNKLADNMEKSRRRRCAL